MFIAVGIFGVATVIFGLSRSLWLSLAALAVGGAADMISVIIRGSLIAAGDSAGDARPGERSQLAVHWRIQ